MASMVSVGDALGMLVPELVLCAAALLMLMAGAYLKERALESVLILSAAALTLAFLCQLHYTEVHAIFFKEMFVQTPVTAFAKLLVLGASVLALMLSFTWIQSATQRKFEYPVLMLLAVVGLLLMISANDFLSLYMALELASLCLYVMASFDRDDAIASEAGLKYFVLGALASGLLLFGVSLVYGFTGTTNFAQLAVLFTQEGYLLTAGVALGLVFVMVGLCFKVSAVPFHMWTPDVYEGAPTPVVTFFAVAPKVAALVLFARLLTEPFAALEAHWQPIMQFVAIASMLVGAFGALLQTSIKRLLAYSSIGHVGYALIGIVVANQQGLQALLIYLSLYLFMSIGTFGVVLMMRRAQAPMLLISDLGGASKLHPKLALFVALMMFSMAGIPPLAGFFGKFYIFKAALEAQLYPLVVIGLMSSVVAAYYYLRIVKVMYFDEVKESFEVDYSPYARAVLLLCAVVTAFFFLSPNSLLEMTAKASGLM